MGYRMKGSPVNLGTIQGTSGHASALKQKLGATEGGLYNPDEGKTSEELAEERGKIIAENEAAKETSKLRGQLRKLQEKNKKEPSEKTKRLQKKVTKTDKATSEAYVEKELSEAREGKYGKGLFKGALRRKGAKRKHKRAGEKEDKTREELGKSEAWDKLTPDQKIAKRRERMAYLTAMFDSDASSMYQVSRDRTRKTKGRETEQVDRSRKHGDLKPKKSFANISGAMIPMDSFIDRYGIDVGEEDYSDYTTEELMKRREDPTFKKQR